MEKNPTTDKETPASLRPEMTIPEALDAMGERAEADAIRAAASAAAKTTRATGPHLFTTGEALDTIKEMLGVPVREETPEQREERTRRLKEARREEARRRDLMRIICALCSKFDTNQWALGNSPTANLIECALEILDRIDKEAPEPDPASFYSPVTDF